MGGKKKRAAAEAELEDLPAVEAASQEQAPSSSDGDDEDSFPSGAEDSPEQSSDDEDGEAFDSVDVDFEFFDPAEKDFHGLKTLLHPLLDGEQWDCSELVDAIIKQSEETGVGTVIKCGEEDDPIGLTTVLSLQQHGERLRSLAQLRAFLEAHCPNDGARRQLATAWAAPATGLLLSERLVNSPPQLAPPLQEALFSEVASAAADGDLPPAQRESFAFKQYLMLLRAYADPTAQQGAEGQGAGSSGGKKKKKKKKGQQPGGAAPAGATGAAGPSLVHVLPEAECYQQHADWVVAFPTPGRLVAKDDLQPCRCMMLVPAGTVPAARRALDALLQNVGR